MYIVLATVKLSQNIELIIVAPSKQWYISVIYSNLNLDAKTLFYFYQKIPNTELIPPPVWSETEDEVAVMMFVQLVHA